MELITTHTHSTFCEHAKDSLSDMVNAAIAAGITTMAATEHYPITKAFDESLKATMLASRLDEYVTAVRQEQAAHPELDLRIASSMTMIWLASMSYWDPCIS